MTRRTITVSLSLLCVILFALTAAPALLLFHAEKRLFDAELYTRALDSQGFYERLPALLAETLAAGSDHNESAGFRSYLNMFPAKQWEAVIRAFLPAEVTRPMIEQAIGSVFDYLNGKSETASLSLAEFKNHLAGPAGVEAALGILRVQPPCTLEQIAQMTLGNLFGQQAPFLLCNPSDQLLDLFRPVIQAQLQAVVFSLPDSVDLELGAANGGLPLAKARRARTILRFSPLLPLGFLLVSALLVMREWKDWQHWWGLPLLISGVFGIALAASILPLSNWAFRVYVMPRLLAALPLSVHEMIEGLAREALSGLAKPILIESAVLGLIGGLALLAGRRKKLDSQPAR